MGVRRRWKEQMNAEHADMYEDIKGYEVNNECIENEYMWYLGMVWSARQRSEMRRFNVHMVWLSIWAIKSPLLTYTFHNH